MTALNVEGQTYQGYLITKHLPLKELQSTLIELIHEESGARVIHIANDDPENLFSLSFQTLPDSSNGVAHILEHTVLCGSRRFPIKDPFFSMTRRSLNTYMNALTGQDFTCYPASSQVEKDFYNLLEVYLDAVFHPQLKRLSFLQEGHRLAFTEPGNSASPLQIQGVVYNEMKGSMTGSDQRLWFHLFKALTPDLPYAYNSGGDPKEIPSLSYEALVDFHRTFYHPSRCLFFFYGNIPLAKHLDFIQERALAGIEKQSLFPPLPPQPRFTSPRRIQESYPIAPNEDPAKKTIVALAFLTASIAEQTDLLALYLIDKLLTDTDVSPLKLAFLKSGCCTIVDSSLDLEMSEVPWVLICKGCEGPATAEQISQLFRTTLETLSQQGFDPASVEASLHQIEFERTEIGGEGVPFGLSLFFRTALAKQHGADPEQALLIHSLFRDLRQKLSHPDYLPRLIRRYFLDNPHSVLAILTPDPHLEKKEAEEEKNRLAAIRASLSKEAIQTLFDQERDLAAYQNEIEHQSIECLPKIELTQVPPHAKDYPLRVSSQGSLQLFHHDCFTNRIIYADLFFDLPAVSQEDLPLLSFLSRCLTEIGCGGRTYTQNLELQHASLGELVSALTAFVPHEDSTHCQPTLSLRGKAFDRNLPILLDLFRDFTLSANFRDPPRIKELLLEHATQLQNRLPKQSLSYAIQLALSGCSLPAALGNQWQGLPYFHAISRWARSSELDLIEDLDRLYQTLFGSPHPSLVLSCKEAEKDSFDSLAPSFAASLPTRPLRPWKPDQTLVAAVPSQGRIIASPVAFTVLAFATISYTHPDSAALMVATDLLENVTLHAEIREKGGAYGSGAQYSPSTGHFHFYSYRDPHLSRTYDMFLKAIDRIAEAKFRERDLEEAKLGILQDLDAPLSPGQRANAAYSWHRTHRTYQRRDDYRRAILSVSKQAVAHAVKTHLAEQKQKGIFVSFAGEDLLKKEAKKLSFPLDICPIASL